MNDQDAIEAAAGIALKALDKAEWWYCEILEQRYAGRDASEAAYKKLEKLDAEALRATELWCRVIDDALNEAPRF